MMEEYQHLSHDKYICNVNIISSLLYINCMGIYRNIKSKESNLLTEIEFDFCPLQDKYLCCKLRVLCSLKK